MEYGRIEKYNDIYRVVSISTVVELIGVVERNQEFDYAVYPFTFNSFNMTDEALNNGDNVVLDAEGLKRIRECGVISPLVLGIEPAENPTEKNGNILKVRLIKERQDAMLDVTLPNAYRYLNHFYEMFEGDGKLTKEQSEDKAKIDSTLNKITMIDAKLKELN